MNRSIVKTFSSSMEFCKNQGIYSPSPESKVTSNINGTISVPAAVAEASMT
ncbi:MAG: hypothetical protein JSV84_08160 [Gemmatimonadota bacterium]|nr:MAG: hypothetical protein JSV84_08160 [Gemmatimonadota bacterium]